MPETNKNLIEKSIEFAKIAHAGQKRINGEDYINHPLRIKKLLEDIGITDEETLAAAILHATITHADVKIEEIEKEFGEKVANMVEVLTGISNLYIPTEVNDNRILNLHKLFIQLSRDMRVLPIKLADKVDNIRTAKALPPEKQKWTAQKAQLIYAPIAQAAGVNVFKDTLLDESLKILDNDRYKQIDAYLKTKEKEMHQYLDSTRDKLQEFLSENDIEAEITYRTKGIYSIHKKTNRYNRLGRIDSADAFDSLFDQLGIRILVDSIEDCYKVLAFIQSHWQMYDDEYDDYIMYPKPNGYRSLQTAIKLDENHSCEVQIRTHEMHEFNEYGPASHFSYKYNVNSRSREPNKMNWMKSLILQKDEIQNSIVNDSSINLFEDTIFVFTPKDDLITLPAKSTAVDFAYAVHTTIGNRCNGARVNGKMVKLDSILESGSVVEVLVDRNHTPPHSWLDFVQTNEAKRQIRKFRK